MCPWSHRKSIAENDAEPKICQSLSQAILPVRFTHEYIYTWDCVSRVGIKMDLSFSFFNSGIFNAHF